MQIIFLIRICLQFFQFLKLLLFLSEYQFYFNGIIRIIGNQSITPSGFDHILFFTPIHFILLSQDSPLYFFPLRYLINLLQPHHHLVLSSPLFFNNFIKIIYCRRTPILHTQISALFLFFYQLALLQYIHTLLSIFFYIFFIRQTFDTSILQFQSLYQIDSQLLTSFLSFNTFIQGILYSLYLLLNIDSFNTIIILISGASEIDDFGLLMIVFRPQRFSLLLRVFFQTFVRWIHFNNQQSFFFSIIVNSQIIKIKFEISKFSIYCQLIVKYIALNFKYKASQNLLNYITSNIQRLMPKLKKHSSVKNQDESNTNLSIGQFRIQNSNDNQDQISQKDKRQINDNVSSSESQRSNSSKQQINKRNKQLRSKSKDKKKQTGKSTQKKLKSKYDADEILKKMQEQCAKDQEQSNKAQDEDETNYYIPKEALEQKKKRKSKSKQKGQIKIKNRFFTDVMCSDQNDDIQDSSKNKKVQDNQALELKRMQEQYRLRQAEKQQRNALLVKERKNQLQQKVNKLRERMEFKNAHEDVRFKEHMKETLDIVKDCQEVEIMIEAPKIFKGVGARQADAALYIKNLTTQSGYFSQTQIQQSISCLSLKQKEDKSQKNKRIDRNQFYNQFAKQVKEIKAVSLPTQTNQIFKKSSLEQLEDDLQNNQHLFKEDTRSRNSMPRSQNSMDKMRRSVSISRQKQNSNSKSNTRVSITNKDLRVSGKSIQVVQQKQNQESKQTKIAEKNKQDALTNNKQKQDKSLLTQNKSAKESKTNGKKQLNKENNKKSNTKKKQTKQSQNNHKKRKPRKKSDAAFHKSIKQLFEQEAEDSQNGLGDDGCSSESGDDSSVDSIIDRGQVKYVKKNQMQARRKYMSEEMKRDEQIIKKIKQKITAPRKILCEQSSQSRQRRKKRMDEARKKFEDEDGNDDGKFVDSYQDNQQKNQETKNSHEELSKMLQNLQSQILPQSKPQQKRQPKPSIQANKGKSKNKTIWQQMKIVSKPETQAGKDKRGGFVNHNNAVTGNKIKVGKTQKSKEKFINF